MAEIRLTARQEWRQHWLLVFAASVGVSFFSFMSPALGLFFDSLHAEFGWSRTELTLGMTSGALITVVASPFVGRLIDRWGSRRLALPGVVYDQAGSYAPLLWAGAVISLVSAVLVFSLGRYPDWDADRS